LAKFNVAFLVLECYKTSRSVFTVLSLKPS